MEPSTTPSRRAEVGPASEDTASTTEHSALGERGGTFVKRASEAVLLSIGLTSLVYALVTALNGGIDLRYSQVGAGAWLQGSSDAGSDWIYAYPPFTVVLLAPTALISFKLLSIVWLVLNISAAAIVIVLIGKLYGQDWQRRPKLYIFAFLVSLAGFRVCLRNGQISLLILAALLGTLVARYRGNKNRAGILFGLALCKFSLSFPFALYFLWKKEWRILSVALLVPLILFIIYSARLDESTSQLMLSYAARLQEVSGPGFDPFTRTTELTVLLWPLVGWRWTLATLLRTIIVVIALGAMLLLFSRTKIDERVHYALLATFALWSVYHRTYDSVLLVVPAALLIDTVVKRGFKPLTKVWVVCLAIFIFGLPGLLTSRLGLSAEDLHASIAGFLALHIEQLAIQTLFWSSLLALWRAPVSGRQVSPS